MHQCDAGLIGLGIMGQNLVQNMLSKGYRIAVFNRTSQKTKDFIAKIQALNKEHGCNDHESSSSSSSSKSSVCSQSKHRKPRRLRLHACYSLDDLLNSLKQPRVIFLMVNAGPAVDQFLDQLKPHLKCDDVIVDLGNSHYEDTLRRCNASKQKFRYIGCGISGGEEGAKNGPALMAGGDAEGWPIIKKLLCKVAAKTCEDKQDKQKGGVNVQTEEAKEKGKMPCCEWIGNDGAGHFVKMVHNGIEYAEMALIAEIVYLLGRENAVKFFKNLKNCELKGYLTEIIVKILTKKVDDKCDKGDKVDVANKDTKIKYLVDTVDDLAESKGTGTWCMKVALDYSFAMASVGNAVLARLISMERDKRNCLSKVCARPNKVECGINECDFNDLERALYLGKSVGYVQGLDLIARVSNQQKWNVNLESIVRCWKSGCIIRGNFLDVVMKMIGKSDDNCASFECSEQFKKVYMENVESLRRIVIKAISDKKAIVNFAGVLTYLDSLTEQRGSAVYVQAMRDYFGAHKCYVNGKLVHLEWDKHF